MRVGNTAARACFLTTVLLTIPVGCSTPRPGTGRSAWASDFKPPQTLDTARMHLEPLQPQHAEMDYAAFMSSREHLRRTLHWGSWPSDDATVEGNRNDLERHWKEFTQREAYAYTVLRPDRSACVGCIYLDPQEGEPRTAKLAYWVVEPGVVTGLDAHLLESVLDWIARDWPLDKIVLRLHTDDSRDIGIAEKLRLKRAGPPSEDHVTYLWVRKAS